MNHQPRITHLSQQALEQRRGKARKRIERGSIATPPASADDERGAALSAFLRAAWDHALSPGAYEPWRDDIVEQLFAPARQRYEELFDDTALTARSGAYVRDRWIAARVERFLTPDPV